MRTHAAQHTDKTKAFCRYGYLSLSKTKRIARMKSHTRKRNTLKTIFLYVCFFIANLFAYYYNTMILGDFAMILGDFAMILGDFAMILGDFAMILGDFAMILGDFAMICYNFLATLHD